MAESKNKLVGEEVGVSGTNIQHGMISAEEYNRDLVGRRAIDIWEQMRRSDATVRAALAAIKQPVLSAVFEVDAASDDAKDIEVRDFVKHDLFEMLPWKKVLGEILTFLEFGHDVHELVFEPMDVLGKRRIALTKLAYRKQTTIQKWETEDKQPGITQFTGFGDRYSIPIEKLVRFTLQQEGDNYEGISILRAAYKHWHIKDKLYKIDAVGHEKHALGVLDITYGKGVSEEQKKKAREAARNMRANEQSFVEHTEGITFQFMDMKANTLRDMKPSIEHHDRQIMKNVLAQFLELGGGSGSGSGSRAVSEDHSRLYMLSVQEIAGLIVNTLQKYVINRLVDLNFTVSEYPKLRVEKISDDNIQIMSEALAKLIPAGIIHPRPADENSVRKMLGLAQVEEKELQKLFDAGDTDGQVNESIELKAARVLAASIEKRLYDTSPAP